MTRLEARVAEDALLRLAGGPVVVRLLVGAAGNAHAPGSALVLAQEHDAVLATLVQGAGGARGYATRIDAVVADAGEVEEHHLLELVQLCTLLPRHPFEVGVVGGVDRRASEVVVPVRARLHV